VSAPALLPLHLRIADSRAFYAVDRGSPEGKPGRGAAVSGGVGMGEYGSACECDEVGSKA